MNRLALIPLAALVLAACQDATEPDAQLEIPRPQFAISTTGVSITEIGNFGGVGSQAFGINDREEVTGESTCESGGRSCGTRVFLWTERDGLSVVNVRSPITRGRDISNLTHIVGRRFVFAPLGLFAFLWTEQDGVTDLGSLSLGPGGSTNTEGRGVNILGQVVGGSTSPTGFNAFLWTAEDGMINLGTLPGGTFSDATDINAWGQVVGSSETASFRTHAFLWTAQDGMMDLGILPGGIDFSRAAALNDQEQVVGLAITASGRQTAFLWTRQDGMIDLGTLPGHVLSEASAINTRGVVVGVSRGAVCCPSRSAVVWRP